MLHFFVSLVSKLVVASVFGDGCMKFLSRGRSGTMRNRVRGNRNAPLGMFPEVYISDASLKLQNLAKAFINEEGVC